MKEYDSEHLRNVGFVGHGDSGKTSLVSALLYSAGAVSRLGRVEEGNTVTDYEDDEIERKVTINTALAYCEWRKRKINILDTPGYSAFILDAKASLIAADTVVVVVDAVAGVEVQTEKVWEFADGFGLSKAIVISKMDRERASFRRSLNSLQETFGRSVTPLQLPVGQEKDFRGIVDLIRGKAYIYKTDGSGQFTEEAIPSDMAGDVESKREELIEMIAESDDALMGKFFEDGSLSEEDMVSGLRKSIQSREIIPLFCASGTLNIGSKQLLDSIVDLFPSPLERAQFDFRDPRSGETATVKAGPDGPPASFLFKTLADPFAGRISLLKVVSGSIESDSVLHNLNQESDERLGTLQSFQGKAHDPLPVAHYGDIYGVLKLKTSVTGDTLAESGFGALVQKVEFPEPAISFAIEPKSRGDEEKISTAISKLLEEDPSIFFRRDPQTNEFLLSGSGQLHIEVVVNKLKKKFGVDVLLKTPKVPYRETITGSADVQGRHKKQTGGHGQFGDCKIRMVPNQRGSGFEFVDKLFGGSIPRQYVPAVEKGIQEASLRGFLAGFPVVDFKVTLYDGSYHDVDSSEMAFKIAGSLAFKKAMETARPVLLEPIMDVEIYVPEDSAGDAMGDLNSRRGRIQGMDMKGNSQIIRAQVPLAELLNYAPTLTSLTGGRGSYTMRHSHYDPVPHNIAEKVIEAAKRKDE